MIVLAGFGSLCQTWYDTHDPPFTSSQVWGVHWTHLQVRPTIKGRRTHLLPANNRSFSLSLWLVSVRGTSVCVHGWIICQLQEQFMLSWFYILYCTPHLHPHLRLTPPDAQDQEENQPPQWPTTKSASQRGRELPGIRISICTPLTRERRGREQPQGQEVKEGCLVAATGEDLGLSGQTQGVSAHCLDTKQMTRKLDPVLR